MSIEVMTLVWKHYPEGGSELLLALALADIGQDDGSRIHPSVQFMAHKTRMSERNIQYLLAKMLERGILQVVRKGGRHNGQNFTTKYRIDIEALSALPIDRVQTLHPQEQHVDNPVDNSAPGVQETSTRGAKERIPGVKPVAPNPSLSVKIRTPVEKDQSQNRSPGPACANPACKGPLTAGHTKMAIGDVCNPCYQDYLDSKWDPAKERAA